MICTEYCSMDCEVWIVTLQSSGMGSAMPCSNCFEPTSTTLYSKCRVFATSRPDIDNAMYVLAVVICTSMPAVLVIGRWWEGDVQLHWSTSRDRADAASSDLGERVAPIREAGQLFKEHRGSGSSILEISRVLWRVPLHLCRPSAPQTMAPLSSAYQIGTAGHTLPMQYDQQADAGGSISKRHCLIIRTKGPNIERTYLSVPILTGPSPANSGTLGS
ncbi:hypothetical protein HDV62DRAFT_318615 [Trichoderma sp. SZMC 28011]